MCAAISFGQREIYRFRPDSRNYFLETNVCRENHWKVVHHDRTRIV